MRKTRTARDESWTGTKRGETGSEDGMTSDTDEPTPWEEINPPMGSAPRPAPRSKSSVDDARTVFRNELTACLALTAPAGMTEEGRRDWLAVAWDTLKDLPPDILAIGARAARKKCDHPSKIVPTIIAETEQQMRWRSEARYDQPQLPGPKQDYISAEEAAEILRQYGLKRDPAANLSADRGR
jgi:hypothetical protein